MRCSGRRVFTTSPVRWAPISTLTSFDSFATDHALFISPSMSMPIRVADTRRCKGAKWFLMRPSKIWNGLVEAFRVFTIVLFLVVVQREPTPDQSANLLLAGTSRFFVIQELLESIHTSRLQY